MGNSDPAKSNRPASGRGAASPFIASCTAPYLTPRIAVNQNREERHRRIVVSAFLQLSRRGKISYKARLGPRVNAICGPKIQSSEETPMSRIVHIALKVPDLEKATKFYESVFGFQQTKT